MAITRRLFIAGMLAGIAAPAIVRSGVLMPIRPAIIVPDDAILLLADFAQSPDVFDLQKMIESAVRALDKNRRLDPLGTRGHVKATWKVGHMVLNEDWMA